MSYCIVYKWVKMFKVIFEKTLDNGTDAQPGEIYNYIND